MADHFSGHFAPNAHSLDALPDEWEAEYQPLAVASDVRIAALTEPIAPNELADALAEIHAGSAPGLLRSNLSAPLDTFSRHPLDTSCRHLPTPSDTLTASHPGHLWPLPPQITITVATVPTTNDIQHFSSTFDNSVANAQQQPMSMRLQSFTISPLSDSAALPMHDNSQ